MVEANANDQIPEDLSEKYLEKARFLIEKGYVPGYDLTQVDQLALEIYRKEKGENI